MRLKELVSDRRRATLPEFLALSKEIEGSELECLRTLRLALLTSSTTRGLKDVLRVKCAEIDVFADFYESPYNQVAQEVLDPASGLYRFDPELVILFVDTRSLLGELFFQPYPPTLDRRAWAEEKLEELNSVLSRLEEGTRATILVHDFEVPLHSPLGILERKQSFGFRESVEHVNRTLRERVRTDSRLYTVEYDGFCAAIGKARSLDWKMYYLGDMKLDPRYFPALADEYMAFIKPFVSKNRKCLVLDLDGTLWGGVVGEDGIEGIRLGPTPEGRPYLELQKHVTALHQRGVMLAIASRNNPEDAFEVLRRHPHCVLREEHFAAVRIDWEDKASQLRAIAEELDIGLDSLVFIDDDPVNVELVHRSLPEVLAIPFPEDAARAVSVLNALNDFNTLQLTEEDLNKGSQYRDQRKRRDFRISTKDLDEYLEGLQTVVTIEGPTRFNLPRLAQLTQKTNQFNMTTRRYVEADLENLANDGAHRVVGIRVEDKFGDSGLTGLVIAETGTDEWRIDSFLLSCRVIGRRVEEALLAYLADEAKRSGARLLLGEFLPTRKNAPASGFYERNGFQRTGSFNGVERWERSLARPLPFPDAVEIRVGAHE